jgi:hypothetical protein
MMIERGLLDGLSVPIHEIKIVFSKWSRYTKKLYGANGYAKYAEAMAVCADAREAAEILKRRLPV